MSFSIKSYQHQRIISWLNDVIIFTTKIKEHPPEKISNSDLLEILGKIEKAAHSARHQGTTNFIANRVRAILELLNELVVLSLTTNGSGIIDQITKLYSSGEKILEETYKDKSQKPEHSTEESRLIDLELELVSAYNSLKEIRSEIAESKAKLQQTTSQYAELREQISSIQTVTAQSLAESQEAVDTIISKLREKEKEVDSISGIISGKSIGGSYERSAHNERKWANLTRFGSLTLMTVIAIIIGQSLLSTGDPDFNLKTAILRLVFSAALSIPAAYLSRESTRHRNKQYEFQQMSLELQAITPYIASLPDEEQHKLKAEMATRLFGSKGQINNSESYPINIQEILTKIIEKIPASTSKEGESTKQN